MNTSGRKTNDKIEERELGLEGMKKKRKRKRNRSSRRSRGIQKNIGAAEIGGKKTEKERRRGEETKKRTEGEREE